MDYLLIIVIKLIAERTLSGLGRGGIRLNPLPDGKGYMVMAGHVRTGLHGANSSVALQLLLLSPVLVGLCGDQKFEWLGVVVHEWRC